MIYSYTDVDRHKVSDQTGSGSPLTWILTFLLTGSALDLDSLDGDRNSSEQPSHNGSQIGKFEGEGLAGVNLTYMDSSLLVVSFWYSLFYFKTVPCRRLTRLLSLFLLAGFEHCQMLVFEMNWGK